jgi:WD40 repeat protein
MTNVMVSYSRKDSEIARKLIQAFKDINLDVWVDWEDIPPAVGWLDQILRGIEESDAFIFLISPDSIKSEVCNVEIGHAGKNHKRIIPIVIREVDAKMVNPIIRDLNWIFLKEEDEISMWIAKVKTAIELDIEWLEEHRRLQVRALEWDRKKDMSLLLRGRDLRYAAKMVRSAVGKDPTPAELQHIYIHHSRRNERLRYTAWIAAAIAVFIMIILSLTALSQSRLARANALRANANADQAIANQRVAEQNERKAQKEEEAAVEAKTQAEAQRGVARAQIYQSRVGGVYTSTLLAIDSWTRLPSQEAGDILRKNISLLPIPVEQVSQRDRINALEFSPVGDTFLTASADNTVCVWMVRDGTELFCRTSSGSMNDAAFGPSGDIIVAGNALGDVLILNAETGDIENEYQLGVPVISVNVSPDGKFLAASRDDGKIDFYNLETRKFSFQFSTEGRIRVAAFSPDGRWMVAGTDIGSVTIWNIANNQVFSASGHRGEVLAVTFSPDSRLIVSGGTDNVAFINQTVTGDEFFRVPHEDWVKDIAFSPDGSWFVTVSYDRRVRVWDTDTASERIRMLQESFVDEVQVSANGKWIATTGLDRTIRVWNAATGAEIFQIPLGNSGTMLAFSADEKYLVSGDAGGEISIWDISEIPAATNYLQFQGLTGDLQFSPTGEWLAASDENRIWLLDSGQLSTLTGIPNGPYLTLDGNVKNIVISSDANWMAASTDSGEVVLQNTVTRAKRTITQSNFEVMVAFSSDGQQLITGRYDGLVQTWDVNTGELVNASLFDADSSIQSLATNSDLLAVGLLNKIVILNLVNGEVETELESLGGHPLVAFNADGSLLASSNSNDQINIWKQENDEFTPLAAIASEKVYSMTFNPRGDELLAGVNNAVYLFDPLTGGSIARIPHNDTVNGLAFSTDGTLLATSSLKVVQFWDSSNIQVITDEELIDQACSHLIQNFDRAQWSAFFGEEPYRPLCGNLETPK